MIHFHSRQKIGSRFSSGRSLAGSLSQFTILDSLLQVIKPKPSHFKQPQLNTTTLNMVAKTKISPSLVVDEGKRREQSSAPKDFNDSRLNRADSFSEYSAFSRRTESFDGSVTSSPCISVAPAPSAANVRSRFLNRLGFSPPMHQSKTFPAKRVRSDSRDSSEPSFQVLLKGDDEESRLSSSSSRPFSFFDQFSSMSSVTSSDSDSSVGEGERSVRFAPSVTVHPIPKHTAYSQRIRQTIWTAPAEMQENAARNCLEFAAENWDWRQVAEDQDMVYYNGEPVHPVHFAQEYNIRRQFCAVMSAQSQTSA